MPERFDVIAERVFVRHADENGKLHLLVGKPVADLQDYACRYEIRGLQEPFEREARGVDTIQALLLAVKMLTADLESLRDEDYEGDLRWEFATKPADLGLPTSI